MAESGHAFFMSMVSFPFAQNKCMHGFGAHHCGALLRQNGDYYYLIVCFLRLKDVGTGTAMETVTQGPLGL